MRKLLCIKIPTALYQARKEDIEKIQKVDKFNNEIFFSYQLKTLDYLSFSNDNISKEDIEVKEAMINIQDQDFFTKIIPNLIVIWNEYNESLLEDLKSKGTDETSISEYFKQQELSFSNKEGKSAMKFHIFYVN